VTCPFNQSLQEKKMDILRRARRSLTAIALVLMLVMTTACSNTTAQLPQAGNPVSLERSAEFGQLARGDSATGQAFGDWVVETGKGLIKDAYVRDNNKLGVVISPQVRPDEVKTLTRSLAQGFQRNFPNQDLTVLMYAPDKQLILTARYDSQTRQLEYQSAG
jgi:hypothetical protein